MLYHCSSRRSLCIAERATLRQRSSYARRTASLHYTQARRPSPPLRGSNSFLVTSVVVACAFASGFYLYFAASPNSIPQAAKASFIGSCADRELDFNFMAAQNLPGRPGNLTVDQEVKLQDLWKATLKTFGVPTEDLRKLSTTLTGTLDNEPADEGDEAEDVKADANARDDDKDKKKKKRGLFGRKKKDKEDKDSKPTEKKAAPQSDTADDKYGQTKEYHEALQKNKPEDLRSAFWRMVKADHPDGLLLRFLRARKWDIENALVMMISTLNWRLNEMKVDDDIMLNGERLAHSQSASSDAATKKLGDDFLAQLRLGKSFLHGTDKEGRPMCVVRTRLHRQGEQAEDSLERFTVYTIETARLMVASPVDTATIVFDMTGFSMANMDYAPVKFMIKCFEANYPESLGLVLVHKAPWIFQGIWKIIRGWLDPVVAGKVHFTNSVGELETYVARDHIPTELSGDEQWEYKYPEPPADENDIMTDTTTKGKLLKERESIVAEYEELTKAWILGPPVDAELKAKRTALAEKLKLNYWQLDPYVRARSLYDRLGIIGKSGQLTYYPGGKTIPAAGGAAQAGVDPADALSELKIADENSAQTNGEAEKSGDTTAQGGEARGRSSGAGPANPAQVGLGVAAERSRTATPTRGTGSDRPSSATPSKGPVPAGHEDDGVD